MEYFNPSQKLVFISIFSLIIFHSLPFRLIQPLVAERNLFPAESPSSENDDVLSFLAEPSSESEVDSTKQATMAPESSVPFSFLTDLDNQKSIFRPSNDDPSSDETSSDETDQPVDDDELSEPLYSDEDDLFAKIDVDNIGTLFTNQHTNTENADPKLKNICDSTDYPQLCLSTVGPFLKGKNDLNSVLDVTMKISEHVAKLGLVMAKRIVNSPLTPPPLATKLRPCLDSYDDALYNFEQAMDAMRNKDIGTMNSMLSAALTDVGDCTDELSGITLPTPMLVFTENLTNMTSNCLAIVDLLNN